MSDISKAKLFEFPVQQEVSLRKLFEGILENTELGEIADVAILNPDDGDILQYNDSLMVWENVPLPSLPIESLNDIGDVVITSVADGEVLTWDSGTSRWVNAAPTGSTTPGGSGTQLQYRNGTLFGGVAGTAWDGVNTLTLPVNLSLGGTSGTIATVTKDHPTASGSFATVELEASGSNNMRINLTAVDEAAANTATFTFNAQSTAPEYNGNTVWHSGNLTYVASVNTRTGSVTLTDADVPATVVTESGTSRAMANSDAGSYIRFTNTSAKTATFGTGLNIVGQEFHIRNVGTNDLTLTPSSTTLNAPAGGTLVVPTGGTVTVKQIASTEFDVFGTTTAA